MPLPARWIILVTLMAIAVWLHFTVCAWRLPNTRSTPDRPLLTWRDDYDSVMRGSRPERVNVGYGIFAKEEGSVGEASFLGVAIPVALLAACPVLILVWRRQDRVARGECAACGHQLAGATVCPECGVRARIA